MIKNLVLQLLMGVILGGWCGSALAQEVAGDWLGTLKAPVGDLRLAVHIKKDADGQYQASMDSLDQGAFGIPVDQVSADAGVLVLDISRIGARYEARWDAAAREWRGQFQQRGMTVSLTLARGKAVNPVVTGLDGEWEGSLDVGGSKLTAVFRIQTSPEGTRSSMDVIEQAAEGIPVLVHRDGNQIRFEVPTIGGKFEGRLESDSQAISGQWSQSGRTLPYTLKRRMSRSSALEQRPQNPTKPYPYLEEEVSFLNPAAGVRLAGTITFPHGKGPFPAALLISGSGPNDRDETILGHKPFLVLADTLTRAGIAVLRVDKRGVGHSTGDFSVATMADFASDGLAGIAYLKTRGEVDPTRIGVIGHSEGGEVAPMVAGRDPTVAWVVLMAPPSVPGEEILYAQQRLIAQAVGESSAAIDRNVAMNHDVFAVVKNEKDIGVITQRVRELITAQTAGQAVPAGAVETQVKAVTSNWFRDFLTYDPAPALERLQCPILVISGEKDLQVPPQQNLPVIRKALAHNLGAEVRELPGLNHLFQTATTGSPAEYSHIEQTISPSALDIISRWIQGVTK